MLLHDLCTPVWISAECLSNLPDTVFHIAVTPHTMVNQQVQITERLHEKITDATAVNQKWKTYFLNLNFYCYCPRRLDFKS